MLNSQLENLNRYKLKDGLLKTTMPCPGSLGTLVGSQMEVAGMCITVGDVVFRDDTPGKVMACAQANQNLFLVVQLFTLIRKVFQQQK